MQVRLIGVTTPMVDGVNTPEELLAYCARVSSAANQGNHLTGWKLLKRLIFKSEWSPFEMVSVTMEVETTRDVSRQMLRHRSFSFQEFSQRYAKVTELNYAPDARTQHPTNKQLSNSTNDPVLRAWWQSQTEAFAGIAMSLYKAALERGVAREVARVVLPEGLTPTRLYMAGTLRSWLHYCELRMQDGTQLEHRQVADACWQQIVHYFPTLPDAIKEAYVRRRMQT